MKIELNGLITDSGDWDQLLIGGSCLADFVEEVDGCICKLKYYISNEPIDKETAVENFLRSFYEGQTDVNSNYCSGSSWTGVYAKNDDFSIGGHDIIAELTSSIGKYCYIIVETKEA